MIKTFLIDTPVMIVFGLLFAPYIRSDELEAPCRSRAFIFGLIFSTLFVISVILSYKLAPDWMWMYFPEDNSLSFWGWLYILSVLYYMPYVGGFLLGKELFRRNRLIYWLTMVYFLFMELLVILLLFKRYYFVGTRDEFLTGRAVPLNSPQSPVGTLMNITGIVLFIIFVVMWWFLKKYKSSEPEPVG